MHFIKKKTINYYKFIILFFPLFSLGFLVPSLHATTIHTTAILDKSQNNSVFLTAITKDKEKAVAALIKTGKDVNEKNTSRQTPLMAAICQGNIKIVKLLISAGAELECYDEQGNTPFIYAFYGAKEKPAIVEYLLSLKVDTEVMNNQEQTPLMLAALNTHCRSLKLLLDAGVQKETKGKLGFTALMHAIDNQRMMAVELLIQYGADLKTTDATSFTVLHLAALRNDGPMISLLLKAGADINALTTKIVPINIKKDWLDFSPKKVMIPTGSSALKVAQQIECKSAESVLMKEGHALK